VTTSVLQLKIAELFFYYNEVQNITLRLLCIAVVVVSEMFHRGAQQQSADGHKIILCITRRSYSIVIPTELQTKQKNLAIQKDVYFVRGNIQTEEEQ
jgi:hypothetical protein